MFYQMHLMFYQILDNKNLDTVRSETINQSLFFLSQNEMLVTSNMPYNLCRFDRMHIDHCARTLVEKLGESTEVPCRFVSQFIYSSGHTFLFIG
jgi:hypothetical protein